MHDLAEFHNLAPGIERGIEAILIRQLLQIMGFDDINIEYHWAGLNFSEMSFIMKTKLKIKAFISKYPIERWMENFMIVARKGVGTD
jgi:hypothetical protein